MLAEGLRRVLAHEGVVAIATQGADGMPHLVNTWHSYVQITQDERLLIPAGGMLTTEVNVARNSAVLLTMGSREVQGRNGPGTGFLITGTAMFTRQGPDYDSVRARFPWARAALVVKVENVAQTL